MADGVWKGVYPQVLGCSRQLSLNKFFDPSTPSMRNLAQEEESNQTILHMMKVNAHYVWVLLNQIHHLIMNSIFL